MKLKGFYVSLMLLASAPGSLGAKTITKGATTLKSEALEAPKKESPFDAFIKADRAFISQFAAFSGIFLAMTESSDKNNCDTIAKVYHLLEDAVWNHLDKRSAELWVSYKKKAFNLAKQGSDFEAITEQISSSAEKLQEKRVLALGIGQSKALSQFLPFLDQIPLDISPYWQSSFETALSELREAKALHDRSMADTKVLKEIHNKLSSVSLPSGSISRDFLKKETANYLKMVVNHYISRKGIEDAFQKSVDHVTATPDYYKDHPASMALPKNFLEAHVGALMTQVVDKGVEQVAGSDQVIYPANPIAYIEAMIQAGKVYSSEDLETDKDLILGEEVFKESSLEDSLKSLGTSEFNLLSGTVKATGKGITEKLWKEEATNKFCANISDDDSFNRAFCSGYIERLFKDALSFSVDSVQYYFFPKEPEQEKAGIILKDGVYYHVMKNKKEKDPMEDYKDLPVFSAKEIKAKGYKIKRKVKDEQNLLSKAAFAALHGAFDVVNHYAVSNAFLVTLGSADNKFGTQIVPADKNKKNDALGYISIKILLDMTKRLTKHTVMEAIKKARNFFMPEEKVIGVTKKGSEFYLVTAK